ncbi:hypothetical protein V5738_10980 [Salinisphaera sp. SPP-AMP-43]|uniref:hypothetical protein n=1 Tax=Salinisphaera sp. SPP-AMP-43 TaxID=3121288 RepID=UPI003C6E633E
MEAETVDTPYRSVRHALSRAFAGEERVICKSPMLMGSRSSRSDMTPQDHAAQDAIVVSLVYQHCRREAIAAVTAQYMPDSLTRARGVTFTKNGAIRALADEIREHHLFASLPALYVVDIVRQWAGLSPGRSEAGWIEEMGKSSRTLRNIKNGSGAAGNRKPKPGVLTFLDDWIEEAESTMRPVMREREIIG